MAEGASHSRSTIIPALRYRDAAAAIDWLCEVFGFARHVVYPGPDNTIGHAELTLGGGMIMLGSEKDDEHASRFKSPAANGGFETGTRYIVVEDIDAAYARAAARGAKMIRELQSTDYGSREFSVEDPEGNSWGVGTYDPWRV
jgi:uncharacterized glyoxalase superfamily protein PhnB